MSRKAKPSAGDMKDEYDFSGAVRGKFYREGAELIPPVHLEPEVLNYLRARAEAPAPSFDGNVADLNQLRNELAGCLCEEVQAMPEDNFLVRPKRGLVERYCKADAWHSINDAKADELSRELAGLPSTISDDDVAAKLFDELTLRLQLDRLRNGRDFPKLAERVRQIAEALSAKTAIPMIAEQLSLIDEMQTDAFWQDITVPQLEDIRKRIRGLIKFIEKRAQKPIFTNFKDEIGDGANINLPIGSGAQDFERFKEKVRHFLRPRENELALQKLRLGLALTKSDIEALDRMLINADLGSEDHYEAARKEGLGVFVRTLIGLDRSAAMREFGEFLQKYELNARQQEFVAMVIEELTRIGILEHSRLFYDPFTGLAPAGVQSLFNEDQTTDLYRVLKRIKEQVLEPAGV